jgi:Zn finger protein HypA/HybF involved in hydrogenase expression
MEQATGQRKAKVWTKCPECSTMLEKKEDCVLCPKCGWGLCF